MKSKDYVVFGLLAVIVIIALILAVVSKRGVGEINVEAPTEILELTSEDTEENVAKGELIQSKSVIEWQGSKKVIKEWIDEGTLRAQSGSIGVEGGVLTGGTLVLDMTTIQAEKTGKGDGEAQLTKHLSSADFFDVEKHPTASFVITEVAIDEMGEGQLILTGDMTIKGTTKSMDIPVVFVSLADTHVVTGSVDIDRTDFDVRFGSDKFFDSLGDNVISDIFTLTFDLVFQA